MNQKIKDETISDDIKDLKNKVESNNPDEEEENDASNPVLATIPRNQLAIIEANKFLDKDDQPPTILKDDAEFAAHVKKMRPPHKLFADFYLNTMKIALSYHEAYPSASQRTCEVNGTRLLIHPSVQAYIDYIFYKRRQKYNIKLQKQLDDLEYVFKIAMNAVPVFDKHGVPTGEYKTQAYAAVRAKETIAKLAGLGMDKGNGTDNDTSFIVKLYCVPGFKNISDVPHTSIDDIKKLITDYVKNRK